MSELKKHQLWWETNLGTNLRGVVIPGPAEWSTWMGNHAQKDRQLMRQRIDESFQTLLDVGCGGCEELKGLREEGSTIDYTGVDVTPRIVDHWKEQGVNIVLSEAENLPFEDSSFDVTTARHIIEHIPNFEDPLSEWIRVTKHKILILFFNGPIGPGGFNTDSHGNNIDIPEGKFSKATDSFIISDPNDLDCYSNFYHKGKIEEFLNDNPKVDSFEFLPTAPTSTSMLEIILKED